MANYGLRFISGKYQGGEFAVPAAGELVIGRAMDIDVVLVEEMVSRRHAKIVSNGQSCVITDLCSTNGTFVNGKKINQHQLKEYDRILIGNSIIKLIPVGEMLHQTTGQISMKEMMEDVKAGQPSSPAASAKMTGDLADLPLPDLLQLFASNRKSGVLKITGKREGAIYLRHGELIYAKIGEKDTATPMKAFCRMVGWTKGNFVVEPWPESFEPAVTIGEPAQSCLIEAMRQQDELKLLLAGMPSPSSSLRIPSSLKPPLRKLSEQQLDVFQLVFNFSMFKSVVNRSAFTDFETVQALSYLLKHHYIELESDDLDDLL